MHLGVTIFPTDYSIPLHELAREAEQRGFESLWVPSTRTSPRRARSPWPGAASYRRCTTTRSIRSSRSRPQRR
jgi:alkanesulfonate monooxygenase SsuD/methylene tetrahydromethanopterin reductase-like flavin-dependent oxidoreductase (luciferase family)